MNFRNIPIDSNCTYDFVVLNSCTYSNPNGDPDFDNQPRCNPETGRGEITSDCLKRKIRDRVSQLTEMGAVDVSANNIFIQSETCLNNLIGNAVKESGLSEKDIKKDDDANKAVRYMLDRYFDVRIFGAVLSTGALKNTNAHITGAVQMSYGVSEDPIYIRQTKCVRNAHTTEARSENAGGEFASKPVVEFGLYKAYGRYIACQGKKNGVKDADLALLFEAICSMYDNDLSACRNGMCMEKLVVFKHNNERAIGSLKKYADRVKAVKKTDEDYPHSMNDYEVKIDRENTPEDVEIYVIDL